MVHMVAHWIDAHGYGVIFGFFAAGIIGVPVPNDLLLAYLGHFIYKGKLLTLPTVVAALFGSICGMTVNYLLGRTLGLYLLKKYGRHVRLTPEAIMKVHNWFKHAGRWGLLVSNFIPGVRHLAPIAAGTSKMMFLEFAVFAYVGALVWVTLYLSLGYFLAEEWARQTTKIHFILGIVSVAAIVSFALYLLWTGRKQKSQGSGLTR
jgi:membrane protein DedA with SNARE-associated domain